MKGLATTFSVALFAGAGALAGQPSPIDGRPACAGCAIVFTRIATLGAANDPIDIAGYGVARDSRGGYLVTASNGTQLAAYDANGKYLSVIGRAGLGPGEFSAIRAVAVGRSDTVFVQASEKKVVVLSPQHTFVREFQIPPGRELKAALPSGQLLFRGVPQPSGPFSAAVITTSLGEVRGSIAAGDGMNVALRCLDCTATVIGLGAEQGTVWSTPIGRYMPSLWDTSGARRATYTIERSPWFQEWDRPSTDRNVLAERPRTQIRYIGSDQGGRLWVSAAVAGRNWKPYDGPVSGKVVSSGSGIIYSGREINTAERQYLASGARRMSTTVEVIDRVAGRVLASFVFDRGELVWLAPDLAYTVVPDADGIQRLEVYRVCLAENNRRVC